MKSCWIHAGLHGALDQMRTGRGLRVCCVVHDGGGDCDKFTLFTTECVLVPVQREWYRTCTRSVLCSLWGPFMVHSNWSIQTAYVNLAWDGSSLSRELLLGPSKALAGQLSLLLFGTPPPLWHTSPGWWPEVWITSTQSSSGPTPRSSQMSEPSSHMKADPSHPMKKPHSSHWYL